MKSDLPLRPIKTTIFCRTDKKKKKISWNLYYVLLLITRTYLYNIIFTRFVDLYMHGQPALKMLIRYSFTTAPCSHILPWVVWLVWLLLLLFLTLTTILWCYIIPIQYMSVIDRLVVVGEKCPQGTYILLYTAHNSILLYVVYINTYLFDLIYRTYIV